MSIEQPIGTCSLCGGPVIMPSMMVNPIPHCKSCGATPANPYGPVIPMERRDRPADRLERRARRRERLGLPNPHGVSGWRRGL